MSRLSSSAARCAIHVGNVGGEEAISSAADARAGGENEAGTDSHSSGHARSPARSPILRP